MASLVDYLNTQKQDSSYAARAKLATQYGITGYTGTATQNTQLLGLLQAPKPTAVTTYGPTKPTGLLSGSVGTGTGNVTPTLDPNRPLVQIGSKTTTPTTSNLFSNSNPSATSYTTNSPGYQVPQPMGSTPTTTSYANQSIYGPTKPTLPGNITGNIGAPNNNDSLQAFLKASSAPPTVPTIPDAIPTDMLTRTQAPTIQTYQEKPMPSFSEFMGSTPSYQADNTPNPYEKEYDAIGNEILTGMDKLGTKASRKLELENQAGLSGYRQQLNEINGQLAALNAEAMGKQLDSQGKAIANTFINRQVDAIEREKTVKALGLNAIAQTLQGNITLANDTVAKALDAEFQPITDRIEYLKTALTLNEAKMTRAEKAKANEQATKLKEYEMQVEAQKEEKKNIYNVMLEAAKNGADTTTLNNIRSARTAEEAISYAGSTLKSSAGGLTPATIQGTINSIVNQFDGEPTVKNYQVVAEGYKFLETLGDKKNPTSTDDQGLIYAFAKAMDPNSVVREGEYATVQKYSQSMVQSGWADLKRMTSNQAFLTDEARRNMINTVKSKYQIAEDSYRNIYNSYQARINDAKSGQITGSITDYSGGYSAGGSTGQNTNDPLGILGFKNASGQALNASLSQKFESGGDPGAIGYDSTGGYSYGKAQLAHNNALNFVNQSPYAKYFQGLTFNSTEWRNRWTQVAKSDPQGFGQAQDAYIQKTHLGPQLSLLTAKGLNVDSFSPTLKEVIYSTAVQHGPKTPIVANALAKLGPNANEQALIRQIYIDRWNNGQNFASSTPAVQKAVYNRFFGANGELATALKMSQQNYA